MMGKMTKIGKFQRRLVKEERYQYHMSKTDH